MNNQNDTRIKINMENKDYKCIKYDKKESKCETDNYETL